MSDKSEKTTDLAAVEAFAKLGISVTTLITVFLYFIGQAYYRGVFAHFGVPRTLVSVEFLDLLVINQDSLVVVGSFLLGFVMAHECPDIPAVMRLISGTLLWKWRAYRHSRQSSDKSLTDKIESQTVRQSPPKKDLVIISIVGLALLVICYYQFSQGNGLQIVCIALAGAWGLIGYFIIKKQPWTLRLILIAATVLAFVIHAFVSGLLTAPKRITQVNIKLADSIAHRQASLLYQSSDAVLIISSNGKNVLRIPNSEVREISVLRK